jgi:hypothetical protein
MTTTSHSFDCPPPPGKRPLSTRQSVASTPVRPLAVQSLERSLLHRSPVELNLAINRLRKKPRLIQAFFAGAGLVI